MNAVGMHRLSKVLLMLAALVCRLPPAAAQEVPSEQSLRAAMVFNFLKFTDFPPEATNGRRLRLCTAVGDPRQAEALAALAGRKVGGHELIVDELSASGGECQVVYIDSRQRWNAAVESRTLNHALTISAYPGVLEDGGMIEFVLQDNGIRFDINLAEGRRAGIRFLPQLLRLARKVHE